MDGVSYWDDLSIASNLSSFEICPEQSQHFRPRLRFRNTRTLLPDIVPFAEKESQNAQHLRLGKAQPEPFAHTAQSCAYVRDQRFEDDF